MKFINKDFLKEFAPQINLMNTIYGGVSLTKVNSEKFNNRTEIKISAPGVRPDAFNIYINKNKLIIFSILPEQGEGFSLPVSIPMFSKTLTIPSYVDEEKIEALHEGKFLKIVLPYKANSNQDIRKINIKPNF